MKDFLVTVLPWIISSIATVLTGLCWLMLLQERKTVENLLKHWDESIHINECACHHIRKLEHDLNELRNKGDEWKRQ